METITIKLSRYERSNMITRQLELDKEDLRNQLQKKLVVHKKGLLGYQIFTDEKALVEIGKMVQRLEEENEQLREDLLRIKLKQTRKSIFRLFNR